MKGFVLRKENHIIYGGADSGVINILVSNKKFSYNLNFGGMNDDHVFCTWFREQLETGCRISISYEEFDTITPPIHIGNGKNNPDDDLLLLKEYNRLRQELIESGLLELD